MKIKFEYLFEDGCYGYVDFKDERTAEAEFLTETDVELTPCKNKFRVKASGTDTAEVEFPYGKKITVSTEKTPFTYSEFYECFGDSRYYDLSGTIQIIKE